MSDTFCSLCGVPFGVSSDVYDDRISEDELSWTEEFCALIPRGNGLQNSIWRLTGNGRGISPDGVFKLPLSSEQNDSEESSNDVKKATDDGLVVAFKVRGGQTGHDVAYPMHPVCLELLKQQYSQHARGTSIDIGILGKLLSTQTIDENGRGLKPDWSDGGYLGAEQFWQEDWDWMEEPFLENEIDIEDYDYLVQDPGQVKGFDMLLRNPPTSSKSPHTDVVTPAVSSPRSDCFLVLPQELLSIIICYLPASDVKSVRLASRAMANIPLSDTFWHSRFDFPFELAHIYWDPSWTSGRTEVPPINWHIFCSELLHPDESEFGWWRNRKRISSLMKRLAYRMLQEQGLVIDAKDPTDEESASNVVYRQKLSVASPSTEHSTHIIFGLRFPLEQIRKISIAFKHTQDTELACGMSFHGTSKVVTVGQCNTKNIQTAILEHGCTFAGFMIAMNRNGIVGMQVLVSTEQGMVTLETVLGVLADDRNPFALGKLAAVEGPEIYGLRIGTSKQNTIISVGLLELVDTAEGKSSGQAEQPHFLWQPSVPPVHLFITAPSGNKEYHDFQYSQQIIFAKKGDDLKCVNRVTTFFDLSPSGLTGVQYHFDNTASMPSEAPFGGKGVDFFVDGLGGEMISSVDVFWGDEEQCLGISFATNKGRRSPFNQTLINGEIRIERQVPPAGMVMTGMYMRIIHDDQNLARCNGFGILCNVDELAIPAESLPPPEVSDAHDDHFNTWMGDSQPPTNLIFGEMVGCQPNHGFANWIFFDQQIKRLTACLGSHALNQTSPDSLTGLKFEVESSLPAVLGRDTGLGSEFILEGNDRISEVTVTMTVSKSPEIIGIIFRTRDGIDSGETLFGEQMQRIEGDQKRSISWKTTPTLLLVGMVWSYDLGPMRPTWHGVQPIYKLKDDTARAPKLQQVLYPSITWSRPPPHHLQLRPIPEIQSNKGPFEASVSEAGIEGQTGDVASITVFFNAFLQGIEFTYHGGHKASIGNLVGQFQKINLESGEKIRSVEIHERVRSMFGNAANPREVVCVEGIKFGFEKLVNGEIHERSGPYCGPNQPFGPFLHRQGGLWQAAGNDSADWATCYKLQTRRIVLDSGEVFEGLYSETLQTLVRRIGVLVSRTPIQEHNADRAQLSHLRPSSLLDASASNHLSEVPWLGTPPPPAFNLMPQSLDKQGIYRLWCTIPHDLKSYTVYRQLLYMPEPKHFVIGIEFHSLGPGLNTLLGFRSMKKEEAFNVAIDDEAIGLSSIETGGSGEFQGLESVELLTLAMSIEREEPRLVTESKRLQGVYAIVGERIHAVGMFQG